MPPSLARRGGATAEGPLEDGALPQQIDAARKESGVDIADKMIVRYVSSAGVAYFDTHRVRTLPETVMVVVGADGRVSKIDILSFDDMGLIAIGFAAAFGRP